MSFKCVSLTVFPAPSPQLSSANIPQGQGQQKLTRFQPILWLKSILWLLACPWHPSSLPESLSCGLKIPASDMEKTQTYRDCLTSSPSCVGPHSCKNPLIPYPFAYFHPFTYEYDFYGWTQANTPGILKWTLPASRDGNGADCAWSLAWRSQSRNIICCMSEAQEAWNKR